MKQQKTARERAERALQHMPIMPSAKEAVITIVEVEIESAISDTLEEAAKVADLWNCREMGENTTALLIAAAIRALKDQGKGMT